MWFLHHLELFRHDRVSLKEIPSLTSTEGLEIIMDKVLCYLG